MANVQHPANNLPPSPPVSIEEQKKNNASAPSNLAALSSMPINIDVSESDEDHMSPLARITREMDKLDQDRSDPDRADTLSPVSSRSQTTSSSVSSAGSRPRREYRKHTSVVSRGPSDGTVMSFGSSLHSAREPSVVSSRDSLSMSSMSSANSHRSRPRGSRLRQEVLRSPEESKVIDLFKYTKSRLSDIPYRHPQMLNHSHLTNHDLRRQMMSTIFGWDREASDLIRDEMNRHLLGSPNRLLLAKWLGDIDTDIMANSSESMSSSDWMLLALSGIGGSSSQTKIARAYVQRLLEKGDVHTAATIMIGMGDQNDAIEIYVSYKRYMEALILTAHVFPADWQRQAELIRKWGEWAVQHSQQQLAIRCFSCTGSESSEPWTSPTAQAATFSQLQQQSIPEILSPPLSPPGNTRGPQRAIGKTSMLKLVTTFGDKSGKSKFFGVGDDDRTPIGGGVTPIAESALSPQGDTTAFLRPSHRSAYHTPASARTATPGGFTRQRLPSIGEMPSDVLPRRKLEPATLPTPVDSGSDKEKNDHLNRGNERVVPQADDMQLNSATYNPPMGRAATASPMMEKNKYRVNNPLPSPSPESFTIAKRDARIRNGSRDRKPDGLQIQWPPMESIITGDYMTSAELSGTSSRQQYTGRSYAGSATSRSTTTNNRSPITSERSYRSVATASPVVTGRSLDKYLSSLESAQHHADRQRRQASREREKKDSSSRARSSSRKAKAREASQDRGRTEVRYIKPGKRSPTSPVPMSPEDLVSLGAVGYGPEDTTPSLAESKLARASSRAKTSRASSRVRRLSPEPLRLVEPSSKPASRAGSRTRSRRPSPDTRLTFVDARGRSKGRDGSVLRSPSSPLPMSPQAKFYQGDDDEDDLKRAKVDQKRFRSRQRSTSRIRERGTSAVREVSPDRRRRDRSSSRQRTRENSRTRGEPSPYLAKERLSHSRTVSAAHAGDINQIKDERTLKREQAARDLEERRKSLVRRPSVPPIVHPEELSRLSPNLYRPNSPPEYHRAQGFPSPKHSQTMQPSRSQTTSPANLQTSPAYLKEAGGGSPQVGLPATPRAMRHPKYDPDRVPDVPLVPERYELVQPPSWGSLNAMSYNTAFENLAPLPKTTYQAARRLPPRSASAPIPEEPFPSPYALPAGLPMHPAFHAALPPSNRRRTQDHSTRKVNPGDSQPGTLGYEARHPSPVYASGNPNIMSGIDETMEASAHHINSSNNNLTPPPPPPAPAPPILPQLQHLAMPPPPPPAPLYRPHNPNTNSIVSGVSQGSGVIEIVMDDDTDNEDVIIIKPESYSHSSSPPRHSPPKMAPLAIEIPPPPPPPPQVRGHHRGRSESDNSLTLSGRLSRAAERLRSASRGRNEVAPAARSPQEPSPYESLAPMWGARSANATPNAGGGNGGVGTERHPRDVKAAMEMMEGGMI